MGQPVGRRHARARATSSRRCRSSCSARWWRGSGGPGSAAVLTAVGVVTMTFPLITRHLVGERRVDGGSQLGEPRGPGRDADDLHHGDRSARLARARRRSWRSSSAGSCSSSAGAARDRDLRGGPGRRMTASPAHRRDRVRRRHAARDARPRRLRARRVPHARRGELQPRPRQELFGDDVTARLDDKHDGEWFWNLARDPFLRDTDALEERLDRPGLPVAAPHVSAARQSVPARSARRRSCGGSCSST